MAVFVSPVAGTRTEPVDTYVFVKGTTATFKITFLSEGVPTKVDDTTVPIARIYAPRFLSGTDSSIPTLLATLEGSLVPGQEFEYQFQWSISPTAIPVDEYIISYEARLGSQTINFGDEFFTISAHAGSVAIQTPSYATVDDLRRKKFNIDDFLPESIRKDQIARNMLLEEHLRDASHRLREELAMFKARGNSANYRLFVIYYSIWSILLASRGQDGSAVSDQNIAFYRNEWERILAQEKREGVMQGVPLGRG